MRAFLSIDLLNSRGDYCANADVWFSFWGAVTYSSRMDVFCVIFIVCGMIYPRYLKDIFEIPSSFPKRFVIPWRER